MTTITIIDENKQVTFDELKRGEYFSCGPSYYLKLAEGCVEQDYGSFNSVSLQSGLINYFSVHEVVRPITEVTFKVS